MDIPFPEHLSTEIPLLPYSSIPLFRGGDLLLYSDDNSSISTCTFPDLVDIYDNASFSQSFVTDGGLFSPPGFPPDHPCHGKNFLDAV